MFALTFGEDMRRQIKRYSILRVKINSEPSCYGETGSEELVVSLCSEPLWFKEAPHLKDSRWPRVGKILFLLFILNLQRPKALINAWESF